MAKNPSETDNQEPWYYGGLKTAKQGGHYLYFLPTETSVPVQSYL